MSALSTHRRMHSQDSQNRSTSMSWPFSSPGITYAGSEKWLRTVSYIFRSASVRFARGSVSQGVWGGGIGSKIFSDMAERVEGKANCEMGAWKMLRLEANQGPSSLKSTGKPNWSPPLSKATLRRSRDQNHRQLSGFGHAAMFPSKRDLLLSALTPVLQQVFFFKPPQS